MLSMAAAVMLASLSVIQVSVENDALRRGLQLDGEVLRTQVIENKQSGRTVRIAGPEFSITYGDGASLTSDAFDAGFLEHSDRIVAELVHAELGLKAEITYQPDANGPWLYKTITFTNTGDKPFLLRSVDVDHLTAMDESVTYAVNPDFPALGDWGQPVFTESLWFGLAFPAARSSATVEGTIFLRHYPGIEIAPGASYTTKTAVIGAAAVGGVHDAFMDYVATITPHEQVPRANIYWNGFRVIKPPNRTPQGVAMVEYAKELKELTGFTFDGWTYDAGFDMYTADGLFVPREADIWDVTREALKEVDTPLGFWTSFSPIFDTPTHEWGKTQDFELQHDSSYCLAGPVYNAAIKSRLEEIVGSYGMNSINFDGMYWGQGFGCNEPGHGHLVGEGKEAGVYSTERVVENKLAIFDSLREINPEIILDLFVCNEWASPWWLTELDGVHTVAGDTLGCDIPSPWLRDELITVRDIQVFDEHRRLQRKFPLWGEDLYGTQVRADHLIDGVAVEGESMAARWEDEYVLALVGRGQVANHIICSDLEVLKNSDGGLRFLGEVGNWTRENVHLFRNFRLLGGEPVKRQPYGYSHGDEQGRSIVALRNPWIEPRTFELAIDEQLDLGVVEGPVFVNVVYPYRETLAPVKFGDKVSLPLQDYAVMLLEVRTAPQQFDGAPAGRWATDESGASALLDVSPLSGNAHGRLRAAVSEEGLSLTGEVQVPEGSERARLMLMLLPGEGDVQQPTVTVDDKETEAVFHLRKRDRGEDAWAIIDVPPGIHEISILVPGRGGIEVGAWLRAEYTLQAAEAIDAPSGDWFPVFEADRDRRVTTLLPVATFDLPLPALPEGDVLNISALRNRCLEAEVGFFSVGWDTSCWPEQPQLRIGDKTYEKGLGVHAPSVMTFDIDGAFKNFQAEVGLHGVPPERKAKDAVPGTCTFVVEGDGKVLFESPVLKEGDAPLPVEVSVAGVKCLSLRTTNGGDVNYDDLAAWGDARLLK
jgi:hypothetical protein